MVLRETEQNGTDWLHKVLNGREKKQTAVDQKTKHNFLVCWCVCMFIHTQETVGAANTAGKSFFFACVSMHVCDLTVCKGVWVEAVCMCVCVWVGVSEQVFSKWGREREISVN